jgi:hypothetical protein
MYSGCSSCSISPSPYWPDGGPGAYDDASTASTSGARSATNPFASTSTTRCLACKPGFAFVTALNASDCTGSCTRQATEAINGECEIRWSTVTTLGEDVGGWGGGRGWADI